MISTSKTQVSKALCNMLMYLNNQNKSSSIMFLHSGVSHI